MQKEEVHPVPGGLAALFRTERSLVISTPTNDRPYDHNLHVLQPTPSDQIWEEKSGREISKSDTT